MRLILILGKGKENSVLSRLNFLFGDYCLVRSTRRGEKATSLIVSAIQNNSYETLKMYISVCGRNRTECVLSIICKKVFMCSN